MNQGQLRSQARSKTIDILLGNSNPNAEFYAGMFEKYNYGDTEMTPISPILMGNASERNNIVVTEEAYKELLKIRQITSQTNQEVAYLIFGEEKPNGTVWLDTVISSYKPSSTSSADFSEINKALNNYVQGIQNGEFNNGNKQVICHGHTHGISPVSDNFSFGDLISYVQLNNAHPLFKNRQIETMAMLMPPCGDFNFMMYENNPNYEGFYTFPTVYLRHEDGTADLLPAYQNGNYIRKDNEFSSR